MSGWNDGGRSDKGNEEEEKTQLQSLREILNCKGAPVQQMTSFSRHFQLDQNWGTTTTSNGRKLGQNW